jgi:hypothetical protein
VDEYLEKICKEGIDVRLRKFVNELLNEYDPKIVSYDLACALIDVCRYSGLPKAEFLKAITVLAEMIYATKKQD